MKKLGFVLLLFTLLLASCHPTKYVHDLESTPYGIDYPEGKWLLNEIESPQRIRPILTKIAYKGFRKNLGDNLKKTEDLTNIKRSFISVQLDMIQLERIKRQSKFDYLILIKCDDMDSEIDSMVFGTPDNKKTNAAETILEVYNLNTLEMIYHRRVMGQVVIDDTDDGGFSFVNGTNGIMISSLQKIMKKIK